MHFPFIVSCLLRPLFRPFLFDRGTQKSNATDIAAFAPIFSHPRRHFHSWIEHQYISAQCSGRVRTLALHLLYQYNKRCHWHANEAWLMRRHRQNKAWKESVHSSEQFLDQFGNNLTATHKRKGHEARKGNDIRSREISARTLAFFIRLAFSVSFLSVLYGQVMLSAKAKRPGNKGRNPPRKATGTWYPTSYFFMAAESLIKTKKAKKRR